MFRNTALKRYVSHRLNDDNEDEAMGTLTGCMKINEIFERRFCMRARLCSSSSTPRRTRSSI